MLKLAKLFTIFLIGFTSANTNLHAAQQAADDEQITIEQPAIIQEQVITDDSMPLQIEPLSDSEMVEIKADKRTIEQRFYEGELKINVVKLRTLQSFDALKFPREALQDKKVFDKDINTILTTSTNTLLSINAPLSEEDLPELFTMWAEHMNLMDEAESAGLYTPPANLADVLAAWRMKKQIDKAMLEAAWILGPSEVEIDQTLLPITIPAGFKFLPKKDLTLLNIKIYEIKRAAIKHNKLKNRVREPDESISNLLASVDTNKKWSASITVIDGRLVTFDGEFNNDEMANSAAMLEIVKNRRDPIANLLITPKDLGSYNEHMVRWLIAPKRDVQNESIQYAMTDGAATKAMGIDYVFLKLGKNQQVAVTLNFLTVSPSLATAEYLPDGKKQADYLPENVLNPVIADIKPVLDAIQFKAGFQLKDATAADKTRQVSLSSLIEGQPTIMEQGVKRMIAEQERKSNFWLFLKDRPRYQAMLLAALGTLLTLYSQYYNAKKPNSFPVKFPLLSSLIMLLLPALLASALVYINFIVE